jgi:hypothetical protein
MTPSRKIAEQSNTEHHRSKNTTDHRTGNAQRPRPARRGGGDHPKPAQESDRHSEVAAPMAAESAPAANDRLADVSAVLLMVLSGVAMVLFFVALAIGPSI